MSAMHQALLMARGGEVFGAGTTWNPADKNANVTLSNGDLTATGGATSIGGVRSLISKDTGKWYNEVVINNFVSTMGFGVGTAVMPQGAGNFIGQDGTGAGLYGNYTTNVRRYRTGAFVAYPANLVTNTVIGLYTNLDTDEAWWSLDGTVLAGDPLAGTGAMSSIPSGTIFLACNPFGTSATGGQMTLRTPAQQTGLALGFIRGWQ